MVWGDKQRKIALSGKDEPSFSRTGGFHEMDDMLRRSFSAIKEDMLKLKESQHQQLAQINEARQTILNVKNDLVTIDKFNVLKIKIGELNDNMKKLWEIDKKLIEVDAKALSEADFDRQASEWENEFEKMRQDIVEMRKTGVDEKQLNKLVQDLNEEFDSIKDHLDELRRLKDTITSGELEKRSQTIARELDDLRSEFYRMHKSSESMLTEKQAAALIKDVNSEFDDVKHNLASIESDMKACAKSNDLKREAIRIDGKIQAILQQVAGIKKEQKNLVTKDQMNSLLNDVNCEFNSLKDGLASAVTNSQLDKEKKKSEKQFNHLRSDIAGQSRQQSVFRKKTEKSILSIENNYLKKRQADLLVADINSEFDGLRKSIKSNANDIDTHRKSVKRCLGDYVRKKELKSDVDELNDAIRKMEGKFSVVAGMIVSEKKFNKVSSYFKRSIRALENDYVSRDKFEALIDEVDRLKAQQKTQRIPAKVVQTRQLAYLKRKNHVKLEKLKSSRSFIPYQRSYFAANLLISVAFVLLVTSIAMFFMQQLLWTDRLAVFAVVSFILGLIIRVVVIVKRSNLIDN
ncbi:MAG: hypothetical protein ACE5DM_01980 [Candidatus Nanoarchaeia archaeon]